MDVAWSEAGQLDATELAGERNEGSEHRITASNEDLHKFCNFAILLANASNCCRRQLLQGGWPHEPPAADAAEDQPQAYPPCATEKKKFRKATGEFEALKGPLRGP